jgi:glycosyltransferase involved in cell wall biosynthesis
MSLIDGADIVCFSNDWNGDPLSKMHLMRLAARKNRVLWVNSVGNRAPRATARDLRRIGRKLVQSFAGVREVEPNIHVLAPLAVPLFQQEWARHLNGEWVSAQVRGAMARLGMQRPIVISFLPAAAPVVRRLQASLVVYYCVDEFSAFDGAGEAISALERELISRSDLVICSAEKLVESKSRLHPRVALVRHGVDVAHFRRATRNDLETSELVRDLPRPVLGFVGLMAEWVDQELLSALADHYARGSLVIVGAEACDTTFLRAHPNVVWTGRQPYAELPAIMKGFDVALVPFLENELTQAANPLKAREYIAAGLPVVSTPIPEVARLGSCRIASGPAAFVEAVDAALATGSGPSAERSAVMTPESWDARWAEVESLLAERLGIAPAARRSA